MVGHKVKHKFQSGRMNSLQQGFEFCHAVGNGLRQIGVDVEIVLDGIGRTGLPFDHPRVIGGNALGGIVGLRGMFYHPGEPHMRKPVFTDSIQAFCREMIEFRTTILCIRAIGYIGVLRIAIEASEI